MVKPAELDPALKAYLDAKFIAIGEHMQMFEDRITNRVELVARAVAVLEERMTALEERMTALEERMTALEERVTAIETRVGVLADGLDAFRIWTEEQFLGVFDRFRVMEVRFDHVDAQVAELRALVITLTARVDGAERRTDLVAQRMVKLEKRYETIEHRLNGFGEDMRQRFRLVNEQLAALMN
ncbi:MAG: hypothetical protein WEE89_15745 [Gemmatimonadota bacterium]